MNYDDAVEMACKCAVLMGRDWYVVKTEPGYMATGKHEHSDGAVYVAEPCYESAVIAALV